MPDDAAELVARAATKAIYARAADTAAWTDARSGSRPPNSGPDPPDGQAAVRAFTASTWRWRFSTPTPSSPTARGNTKPDMFPTDSTPRRHSERPTAGAMCYASAGRSYTVPRPRHGSAVVRETLLREEGVIYMLEVFAHIVAFANIMPQTILSLSSTARRVRRRSPKVAERIRR